MNKMISETGQNVNLDMKYVRLLWPWLQAALAIS